jgi:hypothetical protein
MTRSENCNKSDPAKHNVKRNLAHNLPKDLAFLARNGQEWIILKASG